MPPLVLSQVRIPKVSDLALAHGWAQPYPTSSDGWLQMCAMWTLALPPSSTTWATRPLKPHDAAAADAAAAAAACRGHDYQAVHEIRHAIGVYSAGGPMYANQIFNASESMQESTGIKSCRSTTIPPARTHRLLHRWPKPTGSGTRTRHRGCIPDRGNDIHRPRPARTHDVPERLPVAGCRPRCEATLRPGLSQKAARSGWQEATAPYASHACMPPQLPRLCVLEPCRRVVLGRPARTWGDRIQDNCVLLDGLLCCAVN